MTNPNQPISIPPGLAKPFGCVRALYFEFEDCQLPSVPGTGFLLSLFGEVFFITTRHALENAKLNTGDLIVPYNLSGNQAIPFVELRSYSAVEAGDTDQVDILIPLADSSTLDRSLFTSAQPFDISSHELITSYQSGMTLHFYGLAPEKNSFDYEAGKFDIHFAGASANYGGATDCRSIHFAKADIPESFPDFDGMSGSPLFTVKDLGTHDSDPRFAGMAIQGTKTSKIIRFIEASRISAYLIEFFIDGLGQSKEVNTFEAVFKKYFDTIK